MCKATRLMAVLGLAGALAGLPTLMAQDRDDDRNDPGVKEAIRYEKAKQAAADRQERIESGRERVGDRDRDSADRVTNDQRMRNKARRASHAPRKDEQPERNPQR